jgi:hypothetical protein
MLALSLLPYSCLISQDGDGDESEEGDKGTPAKEEDKEADKPAAAADEPAAAAAADKEKEGAAEKAKEGDKEEKKEGAELEEGEVPPTPPTAKQVGPRFKLCAGLFWVVCLGEGGRQRAEEGGC